jgi:hypothetical protein
MVRDYVATVSTETVPMFGVLHFASLSFHQ